mmetsp:Transcript_46000/g.98566  ORF Transcript_46000/g.98566 Transcript_46000/m.98566 type:complete len:170 (+) Transcript_46000:116-625(+)
MSAMWTCTAISVQKSSVAHVLLRCIGVVVWRTIDYIHILGWRTDSQPWGERLVEAAPHPLLPSHDRRAALLVPSSTSAAGMETVVLVLVVPVVVVQPSSSSTTTTSSNYQLDTPGKSVAISHWYTFSMLQQLRLHPQGSRRRVEWNLCHFPAVSLDVLTIPRSLCSTSV